MGNPSKNPYSKSDSISDMVCDLPPGGRDQNIFSPFQALSRQWELVQDQLCVNAGIKMYRLAGVKMHHGPDATTAVFSGTGKPGA